MSRGPHITISQLEKTACAALNQDTIKDLKKAPKQPKGDCPPVQWMYSQLAAWSLATGIPVAKEHRFHPTRKWRFDFALVEQKIAIEYEGVYGPGKSRHTTAAGYTGDTEKYNAAAELGWKVLQFTAKTYKTVIRSLEETLTAK